MRYHKRMEVIERENGVTELRIFPRTVTIHCGAEEKAYAEKMQQEEKKRGIPELHQNSSQV